METKTLPQKIHAATRETHTALNRSIMARLPLALPPHTEDSMAYYFGIREFAEIYFAFERQLDKVHQATNTDSKSNIYSILKPLYMPSIVRTERLQHDLSLLDPHPAHPCYQRPVPNTLGAEITARLTSKPHTLAAYCWVMYLALFNGGRWMRSQLLGAEDTHKNFYPGGQGARECLKLWYFDSESDGEDIRDEFKARFDQIIPQLTEEEQGDIVNEAVEIFDMCRRTVSALDDKFATPVPARGRKVGSAAPACPFAKMSRGMKPVQSSIGHMWFLVMWFWASMLAWITGRRREEQEGRISIDEKPRLVFNGISACPVMRNR